MLLRMKVIFEGRLWVVIDWEGEGLRLETVEEPAERTFAPFSSEALNVDPTDDEVGGSAAPVSQTVVSLQALEGGLFFFTHVHSPFHTHNT